MTGGANAGIAAAAIANAIKASGAIVKVEPDDFQAIIDRAENPLVVIAEGWLFGTVYKYLTGYKGLVFFTKSKSHLRLSSSVEIVQARRIWIPGH